MQQQSKIKVLHCITSLHPDGAQQMLLKLTRSRNQEVFDYLIVTLMDGALRLQFESLGIKVITLDFKKGRTNLKGLIKFTKVIRQFKPHIIQGWMYHSNLTALAAKLISRIPAKLLWNIRTSGFDSSSKTVSTKKLILKASSILSRYVDTIVYCALDCAEQHEHLGFERHKRKVILNGFVIEQFAPSTDSYLALRSELGLSPTARIVGIVGRNHPVKDHCNFIKAAGIVAQHFPEIHFVMIGREIDRHNENLNEWIKDQKALKNIHLLGSRNDMNKILPAFDLFCLSSKIEGFSNVLGEAMLSAVPCVVTNTGASKEIVEGIGIVVERSNHQQLASAIKSMLSLPDDKLKDLGKRSRQRIIERYSIENIVLEYQKMYQNFYDNESFNEKVKVNDEGYEAKHLKLGGHK